MSGEAEMWQESSSRRTLLRRHEAEEFFGELGIARHQRRSADVVASASLTCLVLSPAPPANPPSASGNMQADQGVVPCDVSEQVMRKVEALFAYRNQAPLESDMFPEFLLQEMFGREYFVAFSPDRPAQLGEMPPGVRRTRRED